MRVLRHWKRVLTRVRVNCLELADKGVAHPQLQQVRERYGFRCGYCGVTEVDVGGELTVDHFRPVSAGGDNSEVKSCLCLCSV